LITVNFRHFLSGRECPRGPTLGLLTKLHERDDRRYAPRYAKGQCAPIIVLASPGIEDDSHVSIRLNQMCRNERRVKPNIRVRRIS
jgi:hypothetical protein